MLNCVRRQLRRRLGRREQLLPMFLLLRGERTVKAVTRQEAKAVDAEVNTLPFLGTRASSNREASPVVKATNNVTATADVHCTVLQLRPQNAKPA